MGLLLVLGYKVWPKMTVKWGPCPHFYVESSGFDMLKAAENAGPLCNSRDIAHHKGDGAIQEWLCPSLVGSLSGCH